MAGPLVRADYAPPEHVERTRGFLHELIAQREASRSEDRRMA